MNARVRPNALAGTQELLLLPERGRGMHMGAEIMDEVGMGRVLMRIAHEIVEKNESTENLCVVGIERRGAVLARRIAENLASLGAAVNLGTLDITHFRDDRVPGGEEAHLNKTELPFDVQGKIVVIVDDVLFTGRTARAAIDAILACGRPARIQLAVLIDRGHRELPIRADYVGKNVPTALEERVRVCVPPYEDISCVKIEKNP